MLDPAASIIDKFGGPARVAKILQKDATRVRRWTYPAERGGTDGLIPVKEQVKLLCAASDLKIPLSPFEFFEGLLPPDVVRWIQRTNGQRPKVRIHFAPLVRKTTIS